LFDVDKAELKDDPKAELANHDPYSQGWVMRLHANNLRGISKI